MEKNLKKNVTRTRAHTHTHTHTYIYTYIYIYIHMRVSQEAQVVKNLPAIAGDLRDKFQSLGQRRRAWQSTPVFLPGEYLGQRSLEGHNP